jgi:Tfp pilus assembly protein PilZ
VASPIDLPTDHRFCDGRRLLEMQMASNFEHRNNTRFKHVASITLEDFERGVFRDAKMYNFSDTGLYFEADFRLEPETEIFVGIENSPLASKTNTYECYRGTVKWRTTLEESAYTYGYGVQFYEIGINDDGGAISELDSRKHPRQACSLPVRYQAGDTIQQAVIGNVSRGGLFVKGQKTTTVGQKLTLEIQLEKKRKVVKLTGVVTRTDRDGFGVEFQPKKGK